MLRCDMAQSRGMDDKQHTQTGRIARERTPEDGRLEATGAYETDGDVVLYDTEEPLAWIESDSAVALAEMR